jgi:mannose-1-phosphate guanylyltransferase
MSRHIIIMAGGSGERFWPASTKAKPKQLLPLLGGGTTLLESAVERAERLAPGRVKLSTLPHLIAPSLAAVDLADEQVLTEPAKRGTAGALIWACACLAAEAGDSWRTEVVGVLTADHKIGPPERFDSTANKAFQMAEELSALTVIGIVPDRPETGFGYIELGASSGPGYRVEQFKEKPDRATAEQYVESGQFLWNSGMFFWTLGAFSDELQSADRAAHGLFIRIIESLKSGSRSGAEAAFAELPNTSIDYLLMEKAGNVAVVASEFDWDDLGSWDALPRSLGVNENDNTEIGTTELQESSGCVAVSLTGQRISILGCDDLVVAVTEDAVLVIPKDRAQEVKKLIPKQPS